MSGTAELHKFKFSFSGCQREKISQIRNDQAYLSQIIKNEILIKYYYKKGLFQNKLTKDKVILEAVKILKNKNKYAKILKEV